jgi:hypothetical protein
MSNQKISLIITRCQTNSVLYTIEKLILTDIAGGALPPLDALLVAVGVADVMSELVVSWPAELGAGGVVIMTVAFDPHPVGEPGPGTPVVEGVPLSAGIDDARIRGLFYDVVGSCEHTKKKPCKTTRKNGNPAASKTSLPKDVRDRIGRLPTPHNLAHPRDNRVNVVLHS